MNCRWAFDSIFDSRSAQFTDFVDLNLSKYKSIFDATNYLVCINNLKIIRKIPQIKKLLKEIVNKNKMGCGTSAIIKKQGVPYSQIRPQLKTFDLILFYGDDPLNISKGISALEKKYLGNGDFTHVGTIFINGEIITVTNAKPGQILILESTESGPLGNDVNNIETNISKFGPQCRDFDSVVKNYDNDEETKIAWGQVINNPLVQKSTETDTDYKTRIDALKSNVNTYWKNNKNDSYPMDPFVLLSTINKKFIPIDAFWNKYCFPCFGSKGKKFCSQLNTDIYEIAGLIPTSVTDTVAPVTLVDNKEFASPCSEPVLFTYYPITTATASIEMKESKPEGTRSQEIKVEEKKEGTKVQAQVEEVKIEEKKVEEKKVEEKKEERTKSQEIKVEVTEAEERTKVQEANTKV
jgi:hypothetical protein